MAHKPSCCHIEEEKPKAPSCHGDGGHQSHGHHKKRFDVLFLGIAVGSDLTVCFRSLFPE